MERWNYTGIPGWTCTDNTQTVGCDVSGSIQPMGEVCFQSTEYTTIWYANNACYTKYCDNPTSSPGLADCTWQSCEAGTWWSPSSATQGGCSNCPGGSRCPGDFNAYPCTQGTFAGAGKASCELCPPGSAADEEGSSSCTGCGPNTYAPGGTPVCIPCGPSEHSAPGAATCSPNPTPSPSMPFTTSTTSTSTSTTTGSGSATPSASAAASPSAASERALSPGVAAAAGALGSLGVIAMVGLALHFLGVVRIVCGGSAATGFYATGGVALNGDEPLLAANGDK